MPLDATTRKEIADTLNLRMQRSKEQITSIEYHIELAKQNSAENPGALRLLISKLVEMAMRNKVLPTKKGIQITRNLKNYAEKAREALEINPVGQDLQNQAGPIIDFILGMEEKDEIQFIREQVGEEIFEEVLKLRQSAGTDWDPGEALKNAHREFGEFGGVNPSICASTTFTTMDPDTMTALFKGKRGIEEGCFLYSRHFNPNSWQLGLRIAAMEDTEIAYPTASGMSAINIALLQLLKPGDEIVASGAIYGGTHAQLQNFFPRWGVNVKFVRPSNTEGFEKAMTKNTRVVYVETEANPTMEIADLNAIADIAHMYEAILIVDNTFAPLTFTPSHNGADITIHSTTKFINGRSDSIGGVICCRHEFLIELMDLHKGQLMLMGPVMDPKNAHQLNLYLNDLPLRITEHSKRALEFAKRFERKGVHVIYPGLPSHPQHELATSAMNKKYGYGGMMALDLTHPETARRFVKKLQELGGGLSAVSLGYFDTLASISGASTSSEIAAEEQAKIGIRPGLTRMSVGYTGELEAEWEKTEKALDYALK